MDPKTLSLLEQLEREKQAAIQREDFSKAKMIKEQIDSLKQINEQLTLLE